MSHIYDPIESKMYPGYYLIPGYSWYAINKQGEIIQVVRTRKRQKGEKLHVCTCSETGRYSVAVTSDRKSRVSGSVGINVLMCLAFCGPKPTETSVASYVDKDFTNLHYTNIQWIDRSSLQEYKYNARLKKATGNIKPISAFNIDSKEVVHARSIKALSELLGLSPTGITYVITKRYKKYSSRWIFSYNPNEDWETLKATYVFRKPKVDRSKC